VRAVDVDAAVRAGADALGFVFTGRSRRCIDADSARELVQRVPAFVARVGLFMDQDAAEVRRVLAQVPLSLLQFHGREDGAFCRQFGLPYIKALAMGGEGQRPNAGEYPDAAALLLDSHAPGRAGGTGHAFDWGRIPPLPRPLVLAGGLDPDNVARAVRMVRPWAVDVSSGVEQEPGVKSAAKMQRFIEEANSEVSD
jgi:phosphoribosylanthranilate isomerase